MHREAPAGLAALAPLVLAAAQVGDAEASGLLERAPAPAIRQPHTSG